MPRTFTLSQPAPAISPAAYALTDRSPVDDLTGAAWRTAAAPLGDGAQLTMFVTDAGQFERPGGPLPSEAFGYSDANLAPGMAARTVRLDLEARAVSAQAAGLDFQLNPRAGVASSFGERSAGAGVVARIGQNLNARRGGEPTWYLFAGAGARAVTIDPTDTNFGLTEAEVQRQAIVGDAQAGLAFDLGPANLALTYMRRERAVAKEGWGEGRNDGYALISVNFLN